jgi:hypothetical protein
MKGMSRKQIISDGFKPFDMSIKVGMKILSPTTAKAQGAFQSSYLQIKLNGIGSFPPRCKIRSCAVKWIHIKRAIRVCADGPSVIPAFHLTQEELRVKGISCGRRLGLVDSST